MVKHIALYLIIVAMGWSEALTAQESDWKLAKSENGVEIYTRDLDDEELREFKAITIVEEDIAEIQNLLEDAANYCKWQDNCQKSQIIERLDEHTIIGRYTSETPWPFSDRDVVLKMTKKQRSGSEVEYLIENAPDAYPRQDDFERIPRAGGKWRLKSLGDEKCEVLYQFYADPGGNVPNWLVKMFIVQGPYNSFVRMKELLAEE